MSVYPHRIVAHRGAGQLAPENTLAALRLAVARGVRAVEFDVMLAGDGVPMVHHDTQLGRTLAGRGRFSDYSSQQLMAMDAGSWHGSAFAGEPVPTYEQVWDFCIANQLWMDVEIKPVSGFAAQTGTVVAQTTARLWEQACAGLEQGAPPLVFSSFSIEALIAARAAAPQFARALLVRAVPVDWQAQLMRLGAVALNARDADLRAADVRAIKAAGFALLCYTVNRPERACELLSWGVDAICTDRIDVISPDFEP